MGGGRLGCPVFRACASCPAEAGSRCVNALATSGFHLPLLPAYGPLETAPDPGFGITGREQPLQLGDFAIPRGNGALARCALEVSAHRPEAGGIGMDLDGALSGSPLLLANVGDGPHRARLGLG